MLALVSVPGVHTITMGVPVMLEALGKAENMASERVAAREHAGHDGVILPAKQAPFHCMHRQEL